MVLKNAQHDQPDAGSKQDAVEHLQHAIEHAAHLLPAQGPITVFIHHNTLHALEDLPFDVAVQKGAEVFGCQPYLTEERFRKELQSGRIRISDLEAVLREELQETAQETITSLSTRYELCLTMLQSPIWAASEANLDYYLAETEALMAVREDVAPANRNRLLAECRRWVMRDLRTRSQEQTSAWVEALFSKHGERKIETWSKKTWEAFAVESLWHVCLSNVSELKLRPKLANKHPRHRELFLTIHGVDPDLPVHDFLVRFTASFLDQGISNWPLPNREQGFFQAFLHAYSQPQGSPAAWLRPLQAEATKLLESKTTPLASVLESLTILGVPERDWDAYISATLLALKGWGGMVREVETRGDRVAHPIPKGSLTEFLAVRFLLDRCSLQFSARESLGFRGPLSDLAAVLQRDLPPAPITSERERAFPIFQLAQLLGWTPGDLYALPREQWAKLVEAVEGFHGIERRRIFQKAYERRFRSQTLDAIALHQPVRPTLPLRPRFQVVTCLDEREESFRRHIEEVAPDAVTYGAAGFFNVVMYYRGAADAHFVPLCPIVLTPGHWIEEAVQDDHVLDHTRRSQNRKRIGEASHRLQRGSQMATIGAALTASFGVLASIPLVARILFPRLSGKIRNLFGHYVRTPSATRLVLERADVAPGPTNGHRGFTVDEMATSGERLLRDIGAINNFGRLFFILGHGSDSVNNPHKSAYDCGACGGSPGAPNGRALAQLLNDPRVREKIRDKGIDIPIDTWFIGGYHNTCDDSVTLADVDAVPLMHRNELTKIQQDFLEICDRNAHERSRRFMSASLENTTHEARLHVENRSEDLAQVRPELGHATNAICIVARRDRSRGLYFDRRAFLTSYDPTQDNEDGFTLGRLLGAAVPVCGGINLEYYFSHVDSKGYGCGTKLPHNVTGLLGVMDGAASDLRTGLPWQMVEIHEPIRLLFVVESTPEILFKVMHRIPIVDTMIRNGWVQMTLLDPHSSQILVFRDGQFVPYEVTTDHLPKATSSLEWYRGWREHLEFAEITPTGSPA